MSDLNLCLNKTLLHSVLLYQLQFTRSHSGSLVIMKCGHFCAQSKYKQSLACILYVCLSTKRFTKTPHFYLRFHSSDHDQIASKHSNNRFNHKVLQRKFSGKTFERLCMLLSYTDSFSLFSFPFRKISHVIFRSFKLHNGLPRMLLDEIKFKRLP